MKKLLSIALALVDSPASINVPACSGEQAKDGQGGLRAPAKPKG